MSAFAPPIPAPCARVRPILQNGAICAPNPQHFTTCCALNDRLSNIDLPRNMHTTTEQFRDARGLAWNFGMDVLESSASARKDENHHTILLVQPADALGVCRTYWDRVLYVLSNNPTMLARHTVVRFDWVGSFGTTAAYSKPPAPTTPAILAAQLAHVAAKFDGPVTVVAQGGAEPIALTFAHKYPQLVKLCAVCTGLPTAFMTRDVNALLRRIVYALLCSFAGRLFWIYASSRGFITAFTKKNLLRSDEWLDEWIARVLPGAADPNTRFLTFSGLSGHFFGDFGKQMAEIETPWFFLAGDEDPSKKSNRLETPNDVTLIRSEEERKNETTLDRAYERSNRMQNCKAVLVQGAGVQLLFEDAELALEKLAEIIAQV